jgi:signal transduction histidine kinase
MISRRLLPNTVALQITGLVLVCLLIGNALVFAIASYQMGRDSGQHPGAAVAQIATISTLLTMARTPAETAQALALAARLGLPAEQMPIARLQPRAAGSPRMPFSATLAARAEQHGDFTLLRELAPPDGDPAAVIVRIGPRDAAVFRGAGDGEPPTLLRGPGFTAFVVAVLFVLVLSVYAVRWITAPLTSFATAAEAFGRSLQSDEPLRETGPREIAQLARTLNEMRRRIKALIDERTSMLMSIGHDLRTPLTRISLRAERMADAGMREAVLADLRKMSDLLSDMLAYLRGSSPVEPSQEIDLADLLQTTCREFAAQGSAVQYQGDEHFSYTCRPRSLARAVAHVLANAARHAPHAELRFKAEPDSPVLIEIADDGPGLGPELREKVFEPFFRADGARPSLERGGFGLGLPIARGIVRCHGGEITLRANAPTGLMVRIALPAQRSAPASTDMRAGQYHLT